MANDDWNGSSGDAVWVNCLLVGMTFLRGFGVMMVAGMLHGYGSAVPALGYWHCVLLSAVVSSLSGATHWRLYMNSEFARRRRERAAGKR